MALDIRDKGILFILPGGLLFFISLFAYDGDSDHCADDQKQYNPKLCIPDFRAACVIAAVKLAVFVAAILADCLACASCFAA